jgi:hypothetical protein
MPRTCTICKHAQRDELDAALVAGESFRSIAERYGTSATALHRHKARDIPRALARVMETENLDSNANLLGQVRDLISSAHGILSEAEGRGDHRTALMAIREARGTLELLGKITGQLEAPPLQVPRQPLFNLPPGTQVAVSFPVSTISSPER